MSDSFELNISSSLDGLLSTAMPAEAPAEVIKAVTPWKKAIKPILLGLLLSVIGMEFLPFDIPVNAVGLIIAVTGYERLRIENKAFRAGWILCLAGLAVCFLRIVLICFAVPLEVSRLKAGSVLGVISVVIMLLMIICLYIALAKVEKKAGMSINAGNAWRVLMWYVVLRAMCLIFGLRDTLNINIRHMFVYIVLMLCAFALLVHALFRLMKELEEPGYAMELCAPKISGKALAGTLVAVAAVIFAAGHFFSTYPTKWEQTNKSSVPPQEASRLAESGMSEELISLLKDEDLAILNGAEIRAMETDSSREAAEKNIPLDMRSFIVRKGSDWYTLVYFEFEEGTEFCGTNGLARDWAGGMRVGDGTIEGHLLPDYISGRMAYDPARPADLVSPDLAVDELFVMDPNESSPYMKYHLGDNFAVFEGFSVTETANKLRGYVLTAIDPPSREEYSVSMSFIKCKPGFKPVSVSAKEFMDSYYKANIYALIYQTDYYSTADLMCFTVYNYKATLPVNELE